MLTEWPSVRASVYRDVNTHSSSMHLLMIEHNFLEPLGAELAREAVDIASTMSSLHLLQKVSKNTYKWVVLHTPQHHKALKKQSNPEACSHSRTSTDVLKPPTIMYWRGWQMREWDTNGNTVHLLLCQCCPHHSGKSFHIATEKLRGVLSKKYTFPGLKPLPQQDVFNEPHFPRGVNRHSLCLCFCLHAF